MDYKDMLCMTEDQYKKYNKDLIEKYPFLLPRNRWTDDVLPDYDYSFTELDGMPDGWRCRCGEDMCAELVPILGDALSRYRIMQIKEKYGTLRWYDNGYPAVNEETYRKWLTKWHNITKRTCITCGKDADFITTGWISPYCGECVEKYHLTNIVSIDEWFKEWEEED